MCSRLRAGRTQGVAAGHKLRRSDNLRGTLFVGPREKHMRLVITYVLTLCLGTAVAFGIAWLVGLIWPTARVPVFIVISIWWLWIGWRYAQARDRGRFS
jgi:hypothetical protein